MSTKNNLHKTLHDALEGVFRENLHRTIKDAGITMFANRRGARIAVYSPTTSEIIKSVPLSKLVDVIVSDAETDELIAAAESLEKQAKRFRAQAERQQKEDDKLCQS